MANRLEKRTELEYIPGVEARPAVPGRCFTVTDVERNPAQTPTRPQVSGGGPADDWGFVPVYFGSQASRAAGGTLSAAEQEQQRRRPATSGASSAGAGQSNSYNGGSIGFGDNIPRTMYAFVGGPSGETGRVSSNYDKAYVSTTRRVCTPGTPAVQGRAAQTLQHAVIGWNGGANSRESLPGDRGGYIRWRFGRSPVGAVVGLASANQTDAFAEAEHAFYAKGAQAVDIVERGATVMSVPGIDLADDPFFVITRTASGEVTYSVPAVGFSYTSLEPSVGRKVMDAALYASGDYVTHPSLGEFHPVDGVRVGTEVAARVRRVRLTDADGNSTDYGDRPDAAYVRTTLGVRARVTASVDGEFLIYARTKLGVRGHAAAHVEYYPTVRVSSRVGVRVLHSTDLANQQAYLPALRSVGSDELGYAAGRTTLPPLEAAGVDLGVDVVYALHDAYLPSWTSLGVGYVGAYGEGEASLPAAIAIGGDELGYGVGRITSPPLYTFGESGYSKPGEIGWLRYCMLVDYWYRVPRVYAELIDELTLGDSGWAVTVVISADWSDGLELHDQWSLYRILERYLEDKLRLRSTLDTTERDLIQYALNVDTGGVARYTGYDFSGFAKAGQVTYGWNKRGVYALGHDTDDGAPISAQVDFGRMGGADLKAKHIEGLFLGIHTDGKVYVRLRSPVDGKDRVYRARQRRESSRVNVGRGLTARRWDFILEVVDASNVELDSIEFISGVSARRWTR